MTTAHAVPPEPLAPWAEIVPGAPFPMTVADLLAWPDAGYSYEIVDGVLVRMAGSGDEATEIALGIASELRAFVRPRRLGAVTGADGVYTFPTAETGLVPDAGFYVAARRALVADRRKPLPFAPDLAVEVASPSQNAGDLAAKVQRYLRGGTRLVWVVWPEGQRVEVWHPGDLRPRFEEMQPSATLGLADSLDGEDVIPGFAHPIADIFNLEL